MSSEPPEISFKELLHVPDGPPESVWRTALDAALADTAGSDGEVSASEDVEGAKDGEADGDAGSDNQYDEIVEPAGTVNPAWEDSSGAEAVDGTEPDDADRYDY